MSADKLAALLRDEFKDARIRIIPFDISVIQVEERVRLKCMIPPCRNYGRNKFCPPNLPDLDFIRTALSQYTGGVLVVFTVPFTEEVVEEVKQAKYQNELIRIVGDIEKMAWARVNHLAIGLACGGCRLCGECPPEGQPCLRPLEAHPGITGFGIDITTLARKLGVNIQWPVETEINFLGMVFV